MSGPGPVEVKTRLLFDDDEAKAALARLKKGFKEVDGERGKTQKGVSDFGSQFASTFLAMNLQPMIRQIADYGASFVTAAAHGQEMDQALAALTATMQEIPYDYAIEGAAKLNDELDLIAAKAGTSGDALESAFGIMTERSGATAEGLRRARDEIESIATVSGVLGKNAGTVAGEISFMEEGMLRTRGQMFQLLRHTGIFGNDIKKAREGWALLTEEERVERLQYGLAQLGTTMKDAPMTFNRAAESFKTMWDLAKEKIGTPLAESLVPALEDAVEWLRRSTPELEKYGRMIGRDVGAWVKEALQLFKDGAEWLVTHGAEIRNAISEGAHELREAVGWILDHKEELAAIWAGTKLMGGAGAVAQAVPGMTALQGALGSGAAVLGAGALAVVTVMIAKEQFDQMIDKTRSSHTGETQSTMMHDQEQDADARRATLMKIAAAGDSGAVYEHWKKTQLAAEEAMSEKMGADSPYVMSLRDMGEKQLAEATAAADQVHDAHRQIFDVFIQGTEESQQRITATFMAAAANGDKSTTSYIAHMLAANNSLSEAFTSAASKTKEGFEELIRTLDDESPLLSMKLKLVSFGEKFWDAAKEVDRQRKEKAQANISFPGAKFEIHQDFRDQDPDRVAFVFKRDLMRAAETRNGFGTGGAFGT